MKPVEKNLCELWSAVFWNVQECHTHEFLVPIWQIGTLIALIFLVIDFLKWGQTRPMSLQVRIGVSILMVGAIIIIIKFFNLIA